MVEELWQQQLVKSPLLFNGSKFRLAGYSTEGDHSGASAPTADSEVDSAENMDSDGRGDSSGKTSPRARARSPCYPPPTKMLRLQLGLTDYRTFRGVSARPLCRDTQYHRRIRIPEMTGRMGRPGIETRAFLGASLFTCVAPYQQYQTPSF